MEVIRRIERPVTALAIREEESTRLDEISRSNHAEIRFLEDPLGDERPLAAVCSRDPLRRIAVGRDDPRRGVGREGHAASAALSVAAA